MIQKLNSNHEEIGVSILYSFTSQQNYHLYESHQKHFESLAGDYG